MDLSHTTQAETKGFGEYRSPRRALAWSFRKSRDSWKRKYAEVKRDIKRFQNQVRDVTKSRDHWKSKAKALNEKNNSLQAALASMQAQLAEQAELSKKRMRCR